MHFKRFYNFTDTNWRKVIKLFCYIGWAVQVLSKPRKGKEESEAFLEIITGFFAHYVNKKLGTWIKENGGWVKKYFYILI